MSITRRAFGRDIALVATAQLLGLPRRASASSDALEEALGLLAPTGPEYGGLSNHGPMAAEALLAMQRPDAIVPWVERYRRRLQPRPTERNRIVGDAWRGALGDFTRVGDLVALFERELAEAPWQKVLGRWLPILVPGVAAVLFHGAIRTAHAVRSLGRGETARRRAELASALGYWAGRHRLLPTRPGKPPVAARPSDVLAHLEQVPERSLSGFANAVAALSRLGSFPEVIDRVDTGGEPGAFLSDLTGVSARVYLANADVRTIAFVHGVTGPAAMRLLLPYVPAAARRDLLRHTWHATAGLYCAFAQRPPRPAATPPPTRESREDLVDRAVSGQDEHAIKLTEACLREHALSADPGYLAAASDVSGRLRRS